ncbi:MAG: hypothetical protein CML40_04730 [Rhodobacteraceae bacterium]|nr:MAG: hypothetical protein CML40_04730 [Paracoccaceae bacterium]
MRIFRNLILLSLILLCVVFLSINSQQINIRLLPNELSIPNVVLSIPAYLAILVFTALGLVLGTVLEYLRTWRQRRLSRQSLREVERLNAKVRYLTNEKISDTNEILGSLK